MISEHLQAGRIYLESEQIFVDGSTEESEVSRRWSRSAVRTLSTEISSSYIIPDVTYLTKPCHLGLTFLHGTLAKVILTFPEVRIDPESSAPKGRKRLKKFVEDLLMMTLPARFPWGQIEVTSDVRSREFGITFFYNRWFVTLEHSSKERTTLK